MKVLVKNIRHINESIFQNMFYKSFGIHNKQELKESIETPSGVELEGTRINDRTNLATYLNKGIFIGSAINRNSNIIPVTNGDRLTYPYVPIIGYGITPLEYNPDVSTTGIRKSGLDTNEDAKAAFKQASGKNPGAFVQPEDIILGWQQNIGGDDIEHYNTKVKSTDRSQTWSKVGKAIAYQQICGIDSNNELVFNGNLNKPYKIYGKQKNAASKTEYVKLVPLTKNTFGQFIGNEKEDIINAKLSNIVTTIINQFEKFHNSKDSSSLKFLTDDPTLKTNNVEGAYKDIPAKVYQKVFTYILQYFYIKANDKDTKDSIIKQYDYIKKGDDYSVEKVLKFIIEHQNEDVVQHMRNPSLNDLKPYKAVVFDTKAERDALESELITAFNTGTTSLTKRIINNIIKSIGVKKEGASVAKRDDDSVVIKYDKVETIVDCILSINNDMDGLYSYIKKQYGKNDEFSILKDIYFEKNKKYYYWKNVSINDIPKESLAVLNKLLHYDNAIGDSGAHKDGATLSEKGGGGFRNIKGETFGAKFMNSCIRAYVNSTKSDTFTINRSDASSMFGDKITSKRGKYRAFIVFDKVKKSNYNYDKMFTNIEKEFSREELIPNFEKLPQTLSTGRLEGKIYFIELNPDVENKTRKRNNGSKPDYGRQKADHSAIYSVNNKTIKLMPINQTIGFSVLLVNNNDNYFFFGDYDSDFFNRANIGKTDIYEKHVTIENKPKIEWVSEIGKNDTRSASQMNYGSLGGTNWTNGPLHDLMSNNELFKNAINDDIDKGFGSENDNTDNNDVNKDDEKRKITTSIIDVNQEPEDPEDSE